MDPQTVTTVRLLVSSGVDAARLSALTTSLRAAGIGLSKDAPTAVLVLPPGLSTLPPDLPDGVLPVVLGAPASSALPDLSLLESGAGLGPGTECRRRKSEWV